MIRGKLKLPVPDKGRRVFLGRLVAGFDEKGDKIEGPNLEFEFGEELEPIQPGGLGFHRESYDVDDAVGVKLLKRPNKDVATPVSVLKTILVDDKRSDHEYELHAILVIAPPFLSSSFLRGRLIKKSCKELLALAFLMEEVCVQRLGRLSGNPRKMRSFVDRYLSLWNFQNRI